MGLVEGTFKGPLGPLRDPGSLYMKVRSGPTERLKPPKAELILRWFEAVPRGPGQSQDKGKKRQKGLRRARGTP